MALNFDYYGKQDGDTPAERIAEATNYFPTGSTRRHGRLPVTPTAKRH